MLSSYPVAEFEPGLIILASYFGLRILIECQILTFIKPETIIRELMFGF